MDFSLKKPFIILVVLIGAFFYIRSHYTIRDALRYAKKHPNSDLSEKVEYYAGAYYFFKSEYPKAINAYKQLLTDYPTGQYAPKALLRSGDAHQKAFQWEQAREKYLKYMSEFPDGKDISVVQKKYEYIKFKKRM